MKRIKTKEDLNSGKVLACFFDHMPDSAIMEYATDEAEKHFSDIEFISVEKTKKDNSNQDIMENFKISFFPTYVYLEDGTEKFRFKGAHDPQRFKKFLSGELAFLSE